MEADRKPVLALGRPARRSIVARVAGGAFLAFGGLLCFWLFVLPVIVVALSSVAAHWSGTILPDGLSTRWFERLGSSDFDALATSLEIGFGVAVLGTALGLWLPPAPQGGPPRRPRAPVATVALSPHAPPRARLAAAALCSFLTP